MATIMVIHDRPEAQNGSFHSSFFDGVPPGSKLIDVFQHDDVHLDHFLMNGCLRQQAAS